MFVSLYCSQTLSSFPTLSAFLSREEKIHCFLHNSKLTPLLCLATLGEGVAGRPHEAEYKILSGIVLMLTSRGTLRASFIH